MHQQCFWTISSYQILFWYSSWKAPLYISSPSSLPALQTFPRTRTYLLELQEHTFCEIFSVNLPFLLLFSFTIVFLYKLYSLVSMGKRPTMTVLEMLDLFGIFGAVLLAAVSALVKGVFGRGPQDEKSLYLYVCYAATRKMLSRCSAAQIQ